MTEEAELFVGPAGWSYDDWVGVLYPPGRPADRLVHLARLFRTIEINSSFYRSPSARSAAAWLRRVEDFEDFRFTAKLVRSFTHEDPRRWTLATRDDFRDGLWPLHEAGRLGPILVQFPFYYDASEANLRRLGRIRKAFPDFELVLEVRHQSWLGRLAEIGSLGYSFCNADLPASSTSIPLSAVITGPVGYLRLHGRNARTWFDPKAEVHEKYDYLYTPDEIRDLVDVASELRRRTQTSYVVANNHFEGQGPANALELAGALGQSLRGRLPAGLRDRFPRLAALERRAGPEDPGS